MERQTLSKLKHPYIAQVFDAGSSDKGQPYFVMEHVEGKPITTFCDENRIPIQAESLYRQCLEGRSRALGENHRETLQTAGILAECLSRQPEKLDQAEQLARDNVERAIQNHAEDSETTIPILRLLADILEASGQVEEAEQTRQRADQLSNIPGDS